MADTPQQQPHIPLQQQITTRDGTLSKDSKMVNFIAEPDGKMKASKKRAGTATFSTAGSGATGTPQGMFLCNSTPYLIRGDTVFNINTGASSVIPGVTIPNQKYWVLSDVPNNTSLLKSGNGLWVVTGTATAFGIVKVTDANYPLLTVPGVTYLDGVYYVMDGTGTVFGSGLEDPTTWPVLNFIKADATLGLGSSIIRHLNYIVAFYQYGTQFYYDSGAGGAGATGTNLLPATNASWTTGCAIGDSAVENSDLTIFIAANQQHGRTVQMFTGLSMQQVSDPFIERIINRSNLALVYAYGIKVQGHTLYVLTLTDLGITLVYDMLLGTWTQWSSTGAGTNEVIFTGIFYLNADQNDLLANFQTGFVDQIADNIYTDSVGVIQARIVTEPIDFGTMNYKRFVSMFLFGDTVASTIQMRYSDDDYQTFSAWGTIDLSTVRKMLQRLGRSRRRSFEFLHTGNMPVRLVDFELVTAVGSN